MRLLSQHKRSSAVFVLISLILLSSSGPVQAQGGQIVVNTTADTIDANPGDGTCADAAGRCSLRAAVMTANARPGAQTILLPAGTYRLTRLGKEDNAVNGDLDIRDSVAIVGAGAANTIIDANLVDHAFEIPVRNVPITLSITGVTIQNANGPGQYAIYSRGIASLALSNSVIRDNYGGVTMYGDSVIDNVTFTGNRYETLYNDRTGTMVLVNSRISNNTANGGLAYIAYNGGTMTVANTVFSNNYNAADNGGAIYSRGFLRVRNSLFEGNRARFSGGALNLISSASVTEINRTRFINNSVDTGDGGAINASFGVVTIRNSVFDSNEASREQRFFGDGGAIINNARMTITNSTFSNNAAYGQSTGQASGRGGAIFNDRDLRVVNSTFSGNVAFHQRGVSAGGGIANNDVVDGAVTELVNVTITGNRADYGGGIDAGLGLFRVVNSIIAGNIADVSGRDCNYLDSNTTQIVISQGHNLVGVDNVCKKFTSTGDITGVAPLLGPLADNGGFTRTHSLLAGSPAIDAGDPNACPPTDQRGVERVRRCDIGAFEFDGFLPDPADPDNLVWNGSFEAAADGGPGAPANWVFVNRSGDRRVCGQPALAAPDGDCAFRFTPSPTENSRLNQNARNLSLPAGATLQVSALVNAPGQPRFILRVRAFHTNGGGVDVLNLRVDSATDGYQQIRGALALTAPVNRVQVSLHNRTNVGRVLIDNVRVVPSTGGGLRATDDGLLPLPPPVEVTP